MCIMDEADLLLIHTLLSTALYYSQFFRETEPVRCIKIPLCGVCVCAHVHAYVCTCPPKGQGRREMKKLSCLLIRLEPRDPAVPELDLCSGRH